jgi:HTH-type transcriptional regulator/antitoxin HigA
VTTLLKEIPSAKRKPHPDYLALVKRFPLRSIASEAQYTAAAAVLDKLAIRDESGLSPGEADYLDALSDLVERYDDGHHPVLSGVPPVDLLKALMEDRGVTTADLIKLLGSQPVVSMILNGKREISKEQAKKLAAHFRIDAGAFI